MGFPNLGKYAQIEKDIRKVGADRLKSFMLSKGCRIKNFDRDMKVIRYCLQHGPVATASVFHMASSYPSMLVYKYGKFAKELIEIMENEK